MDCALPGLQTDAPPMVLAENCQIALGIHWLEVRQSWSDQMGCGSSQRPPPDPVAGHAGAEQVRSREFVAEIVEVLSCAYRRS